MPPEKTKHGWIAAFTAIAILLFVVFLAIPGYIAGYYCMSLNSMEVSMSVILSWKEAIPNIPNTRLRILLTPSHIAVKICPPLLNFYIWEINAGGRLWEHRHGYPTP